MILTTVFLPSISDNSFKQQRNSAKERSLNIRKLISYWRNFSFIMPVYFFQLTLPRTSNSATFSWISIILERYQLNTTSNFQWKVVPLEFASWKMFWLYLSLILPFTGSKIWLIRIVVWVWSLCCISGATANRHFN